MLISDKHKFIFIHIIKNAGTSITEALAPFAARFSWQFKISSFLSRGHSKLLISPQPYPIHSSAQSICQRMGAERYRSYFSFAVVRNPWDWHVSLYNYVLSRPRNSHHQIFKDLGSFEKYVCWVCDGGDIRSQSGYIYSPQGELLVNFVGRHENLSADWNEICTRIGIKVSLPVRNASKHRPFDEYYTPNLRAMIRQAYDSDFRLLGYSDE